MPPIRTLCCLPSLLAMCAVAGCEARQSPSKSAHETPRPADHKTNTGGRVGGTNTAEDANDLWIAPTAGSRRFTASNVERMESMPVQFALQIASKLPVETIHLDDLGKPNSDGVIVAKLTIGKRSSSSTESPSIRLALGAMKVGKYELELHVRNKKDDEYALSQTLKLTAE